MKSNQKGFGTVEIIIAVLVALLIGGGGWYVWQSKQKTKTGTDTSITKAVPPTQTITDTKDETVDWTSFTSEKGKFSLRYPPTWVQPINRESCNSDLFERAIWLGPDKQSVLICGSEFFGQISVISVARDERGNSELSEGYKDVVSKDVTVANVMGVRTTAIAQGQEDQGPGSYLDGTKVIMYVFYTNGNTYTAFYKQAPAGHAPSKDVSADFDLMVTKTLKFN